MNRLLKAINYDGNFYYNIILNFYCLFYLSIEKLETDIKDGNDFLVSIETQEKMLKSEKIDLAVWNFILGLVEKNDKLQN